jgi:ribonuclease T1
VLRLGWSKVGDSASKLGLALVLGLHLLGSPSAEAKTESPAESVGIVALAGLPPEARETRRLIGTGGPFPYEKDGTVFRNRERLLPAEARGFYREYTVKTPGLKHRGARRIVCGGREPSRPVNCYYTADHYASFRRIVE